MKIMLINIDSKKIPNIALKKIEYYHLLKQDKVYWNQWCYKNDIDKVYVSCIFNQNRNKCLDYLNEFQEKVVIGGSGWELKKTLPEDIEKSKPKINIGFTTRGCIRKCPFCIVPQKEGKIRIVGDIYDFWDGRSKNITLLDNNILALPIHFKNICKQIRKKNLKVDFNQGLDCRLLNDGIVKELINLRHFKYRFAFDNLKDENAVLKAIDLLRKYNIKRSTFYILTGFNTTYEEDLYRANLLRNLGQTGFIQRYNYSKDKVLSIIARWVNQHRQFHGRTFKEFIMHPKHKNYVEICKNYRLI